MKKKFLKITFSILCMVGLASCLGDSTGYVSGSGFAYIMMDDNSFTPMAFVLEIGNPIKSNVLNESDLEVGDCASVSFKVYPDKVSGSAFFTDEFTINKKFYAGDHLQLVNADVPAVAETDTLNTFVNIGLTSSWVYETIKDKWLITYKVLRQKEQKETVSVYYDAKNQPNLENGIVYVDFRVNKTTHVEGGSQTPADEPVVVGMNNIRNILLSSSKDHLEVHFRYYVSEKVKNVSTVREVTFPSGGYIAKEKEN